MRFTVLLVVISWQAAAVILDGLAEAQRQSKRPGVKWS